MSIIRYLKSRYLLGRYLGREAYIVKKLEQWISANDAAEIISKNSGRTIHPDYVRLVARQNPKKLASKPQDGRTNLYLRSDAEKIKVRAKRVSKQQEPQISKTIETEQKPATGEQPWWLPEQKEEKSTGDKPETDAA